MREELYEHVTDPEIKDYLQRIYAELRYCPLCQPYEGEYIWVLGRQIYIQDFLDGLEIPHEKWDDIVAHLSCPNCHAEIDLESDIGTRPYEEIWIDENWEAWRKHYAERLHQFYQHLERFPYLGLTHEIGKEIYEAIPKFPTCEIKDKIWYRTRNISSTKRLIPEDMNPPDPDRVVIPEGRFNHHGQPMFYLADSVDGAAKERLDEESGILWLQQFKVLRAENIVDLAIDFYTGQHSDVKLLTFGLIYGGDLSTPAQREKGWKPEYFIPRFIADCARLYGFNGIRYHSSRSHFSNLVLFVWNKEDVVPVGNPTVKIFPQEEEADTKGANSIDDLDLDSIPF